METITVDPPEGEVKSSDDPDDEVPRRPSQVGRVVAEKYELVKLLGEGGMGAVYEARHLLIGRRVAVKFVHSELAWRTDILSRFSREARAAGSLESENIAAVTDFGTDADGTPFLVMEYLVGVDLGHVLQAEGVLAMVRACQLVLQTCRGLALAHAKGIIHRDLKPDNLFVSTRSDGTDLVKILDFGIAKLTQSETKSSTQTGSAIGTPYYMSPEQVRGARTLDHRTDIYALGVILYELLSGKKPHTGESYTDVLFHVISAKPIPLGNHRQELPAELIAIVDKAMAFEADARFQSADELSRALAPFAGVPQSSRTVVLSPSHRLSDPGADTAVPSEAVPAITPASAPTPPTTASSPPSTLAGGSGDALGALSVSSPGRDSRASVPFTEGEAGRDDTPVPVSTNKAPFYAIGGLAVAALLVGGFLFSRSGSEGSNVASNTARGLVPAVASASVAASTAAPTIAPVPAASEGAASPTVAPAVEKTADVPDAAHKKGAKTTAPSKTSPPSAVGTKKPANDLYTP